MRLVVQFVLLAIATRLTTSAMEPVTELPSGGVAREIAALKQELREESLNLREEMYSLLGNKEASGLLALQLMQLIQEMKETQRLVVEQGEKFGGLEDKMESMRSEQGDKFGGLEDKMENMRSENGEVLTGLETKLAQVDKKTDIMRSEVRLISQQKLTWQNSSYEDKLLSDFAVDGVYTLSGDLWGINPINHPRSGHNQRNFMIIIDLGGIFKIHTIKLWNRIDCCQDHNLGVFIYADVHLIGGISEVKGLYEFRANDHIFARKIYVKQSLAKQLNFVEIQVFGSGPFGEDELEYELE